MSKRGPIKQLNHDNWDQDEEPEEAGVFNTATQEEMQKRIIKKAKRKVAPDTGAVGGAFSGFAGFANSGFAGFANTNNSFSGFQLSKSPATPAAIPPKFSFSSTSPSGTIGGSVNGSLATAATNADVLSTSKSEEAVSPNKSGAMTATIASGSSLNTTEALGRNSEYFRKLKVLNKNVTSWITLHVNKNPCCILTPIFRDYENYLDDLEKIYPSAESTFGSTKLGNSTSSERSSLLKSNIPNITNDGSTAAQGSGASFSSSTTAGESVGFKFPFGPASELGKGDADGKKFLAGQLRSSSKETKGFVFGGSGSAAKPLTQTASTPTSNLFLGLTLSSSNSPVASMKNFKFGFGNSSLADAATTTATTTTTSSGFSFATASTTQKQADADPAEEEYVPPKAEGNTMVEKDAFYTKRCKLFYKKDSGFADRGRAILYLKKLGEQIQLLIRADTTIATILLNIRLNSRIRLQRTGKNNILFCCVPDPPIDPKAKKSTEPVMMMVRVKTQEDADELLEKMQPTTS